MKKLMINFLLAAVCSFVNAQDTSYYDADGNDLTAADNYHYYKVEIRDQADTNKVGVVRYFKSGQKKTETFYSDYEKGTIEGKSRLWFENGQLYSEENYSEGKENGKHLIFWENGNMKREDIYNNGEFVSGKCYGIDGKDTTYYDYEIMPEFTGGQEAFIQYIQDNVKYPKKARKQEKEGRALVQFVVNTDGSVIDVKLFKSAENELLDEEALRVVKAMPKWKPAMLDGNVVKLRMTLPIVFKLQ